MPMAAKELGPDDIGDSVEYPIPVSLLLLLQEYTGRAMLQGNADHGFLDDGEKSVERPIACVG